MDADPREGDDAMDRGHGRLLIVDDDQLNRDTLIDCLQPRGFDMRASANGDEALALIDQQRFDALLLDITMPGMDGFEVLRRVRAKHPATRLQIIMLTGSDERRHVVDALRLGANDYIVKPFDLSVVLARIRTQLSLKKSVDRIVALERDMERKNEQLAQANRELQRAYRETKADLESAARVQRALLPTSLPDAANVSFAWLYKPCDELAGDSINVFRLDDDHVGMYLLDVSGHGVRAALLSVAITRLLLPLPQRESLVQRINGSGVLEPTPPSAVAEELNRRFQLDPQTYQFFTIFYGVLNTHTRELRYICAGQAGPVHVPSRGGPVELNNPSIAIGLVPDPGYGDSVLQLDAHDRVYVYSDGLDESRNERQELFGARRVSSALYEARDAELEESLRRAFQAAETWSNHPLDDDVSAVALEIGES